MNFRRLQLAAILLTAACFASEPPSTGILGNWREPTGSVIEIFRCGPDICAKMVAISKQSPSRLDIHNPDPKARTHALCGLQIGYGFHTTDVAHAEGGKLYDPKSGKTYRGSMTADGNHLNLRGYIGFKAFGRSETWTRTGPVNTTCVK
jgi:uncharacterized protein (DUF2147 family)